MLSCCKGELIAKTLNFCVNKASFLFEEKDHRRPFPRGDMKKKKEMVCYRASWPILKKYS